MLFRKSLKLHQHELADVIGVDKRTVSLIESDKSNISFKNILIFIEMGLNINFMLHGIGSILVENAAASTGAE